MKEFGLGGCELAHSSDGVLGMMARNGDEKDTESELIDLAGVRQNLELEQIVDLIEQASALAHKNRYAFLGYLLNMVRMELRQLKERNRM